LLEYPTHYFTHRLWKSKIKSVGNEVVCFVSVTAFLKEVEQQQESSRRDSDLATKRRILLRIQQTLIAAQEVGDEKLQIVQTIQDLIENKARQLELDYRNLGDCSIFCFRKKMERKTVELKPSTYSIYPFNLNITILSRVDELDSMTEEPYSSLQWQAKMLNVQKLVFSKYI